MFFLSDETLNVDALRLAMRDGRAGALATFEGRVRNHNDGKQVSRLEYEAYASLAAKTGAAVLEAARAKFEIYDCSCTHRIGLLNIGDVAVWVGVTAAHRDAAFAACQYIIDEIKYRLPIWKKEHYVDGAAEWVNCAHAEHPSDGAHAHIAVDELQSEALYSRQMILPQIGRAGQARLKESKVLVVGAGGLGSIALTYLAAAGVGTVGICDRDLVEISNLHRQVLFGADDIGQSKAPLAAAELQRKYPFIKVVPLVAELTANNAVDMLSAYDLVLDCSDNFDTKFALNDACIAQGKPLLQASVYQYEGQLSMRLPDGEGQCLRCLWPTPPRAECIGSCSDVGVLGSVVGVVGAMQATEAIKFICDIPSDVTSHVLFIDLLSFGVSKVKRTKLDGCTTCGAAPAGINPDHFDFSVPSEHVGEWELDILDMSGSELQSFEIVDIREAEEDPSHLLRSLLRRELIHLPLSSIDISEPALVPTKNYLFVCQKGMRSGKLVAALRARGFKNAFSLVGGVEAVRRKFIA